MRRRDFLASSTLALGALAAPRLGLAAESKVLKFVPQADLTVLDPIFTTAAVTRNHAFLVFDTLYGHDAQFRPQPQMAEGHEVSPDGRVWTITLRPGLTFHDGAPVLAKDCVASLTRWAKRDAFGQTLFAAMDELAALDDRRLRFSMKRPFPMLPEALSRSVALVPVIMPERLARTDAFTQVTEMVGSGPYRFKAAERMAGVRVVYEKFEGYVPRPGGEPSWTAGPKRAQFERIEWHILPDAGTAAGALQTGEVDWWERPTPDLIPLLRRSRQIEVSVKDPTGAMAMLRFNHLHAPFDNPAIRRAILPAVSQEDVMSAVAGTDAGMWRAGVGVFTPGTPMANEAGMEALNAPRDLEKARRALKEAGYAGEKVVVLGVSDLSTLKAQGDVMADMLQRIGMNVDYQVADWGSVVARRAKKDAPEKGGWNVLPAGFVGGDTTNPITHLALRGHGGNAWFGWPTAPALEELRNDWIEAPDVAGQQAIAARMQRQLFTDLPYIPLGQYYLPVAYRKDLTGMLNGFPIFWNVKRG